MKQNLYYQTAFRRINTFKEVFYAFAFMLCSIPRLLLEVFTRKNFGERYFSFSLAIFVAVFLFFIPLGSPGFAQLLYRNPYYQSEFSWLTFFGKNLTWYAYLAVFIYTCLKRRDEIRRLPSVFDFQKFSLSTGQIDPRITSLTFRGQKLDIRKIETLVEPGLFFTVGFVLWLLGQNVGVLIMVCSIFYSLSYVAAYHQGDNMIMDKIDEMIFNDVFADVMIKGFPPEHAKGVSLRCRRPDDPEVRRLVADHFVKDEVVVEAS